MAKRNCTIERIRTTDGGYYSVEFCDMDVGKFTSTFSQWGWAAEAMRSWLSGVAAPEFQRQIHTR